MAPSMDNHTNAHRSTLSQTAVVMVPLPAQGHLNQLLHLSRLISAANLPVYYIGTTTHVRQARLRLHCCDPAAMANINFHEFETIPFQSPPPDPNSSTRFPSQLVPAVSAAMNLREPVFTFVSRLSAEFRRVVVVFDSLMAHVVQDIHSVANAEAYCFRSISAFASCSFKLEGRGMPELPPGAEALRETPGSEGCFSPEFLEFIRLQRSAKQIFCGDIYNSNRAIEGLFLDLYAKRRTAAGKGTAGRVWAVGPFNPVQITIPDRRRRYKCLDWLDRQEPNSVIFVSFGTTTSMSDEQIRQLALGLERSQHKFIWVVRDADKGDIFAPDVRQAQLPERYEERIKDQGMIVREWAPQLEILGHGSTGGFMSHCGWNSCMESISMGVPIVAWPMHSDQPNNAVLVTKVLRIGLELKEWSCRQVEEVVDSNSVGKAVTKLMGSQEGKEMRKRAQELGRAVRESLKEGGTTFNEMESFLLHITRQDT